ncbi:MAG: hypothetical protein E7658_01675 [Ruminococcaceae bacterium]|nr:hypothetical protein [Oscillospiraceae bacterium]
MNSSIFSAKQIAREALPRLMDNLVFPNLIYKDLGDHNSAKKGDTVVIRRPVKLEAKHFFNDESIAPQSVVEDTVEVKLDTIATVDVEVSALESACSFDDMTRLFLEPAAAALAQQINKDGLAMYAAVANVAGTPGSTPSDLSDFAEASYVLDSMGVPTEGRCAVWSPRTACQLKQIPALLHADQCGSSKALRTGSIGKVFGVENYMSQAVCRHESGSLSEVTADISVRSIVDNMITLSCDSASGKSVHPGDILSCACKDGVTRNVVVADDVSFSGNTLSLMLFEIPDLAILESTVTLIPSHEANLVFHPHAFAFVSRPLATPAGVESYVTTHNGISLRVVRGYDINRKKDILSMDVLYSFMPIYPELAVRYLG